MTIVARSARSAAGADQVTRQTGGPVAPPDEGREGRGSLLRSRLAAGAASAESGT
jgi:hypothetical protein